MTIRKELVAALQLRYGSATFSDRIRILDEFVALTGNHRKHAIRLLREKPGAAAKGTHERNRLYDEAVRQALRVLWEAADRVCGKPLKALILAHAEVSLAALAAYVRKVDYEAHLRFHTSYFVMGACATAGTGATAYLLMEGVDEK
jgi:hypothetical protein